MKKRILLIDLGGSMGGVESYLEGLAGMLKDDAELYALCVLPELARRLRAEGVRVTLMPMLQGLFKPLRFLLAFGLLPPLILRHDIKVVQVNGFLEAVLMLPARLMQREAIYTRHGPFEDDLYTWYGNPLRFFPRRFARSCVRFASHVICVSESVGQKVRESVSPDRMSVIPNWVSRIPSYVPPAERLDRPTRILYVGRLERYKGLHLLIEAMGRLPGTSLTVLGDGSYRAELEALATGLPIRFEGFQSHPGRYYAETDIFVMPSLGPEGLPMVTLEAMAHGLPCLFSDLPVHQEITGGGQAGMLFRSGDAEDLTKRLCSILESDRVRLNLSREAYAMIKARYNPEIARVSYLLAFGL